MATSAVPYSVGTNDAGRTLAVYGKETKYEFLKLLRAKSFSLAVAGFPLMFYILFGLSNKHAVEGGVQIAKYLLGGYACFGLVGAALFGIGVGLAAELNSGWLELKRASPMPVPAYLFAKCASAVAFGILIVTLLTVIGTMFGGVSLTGMELAKMLAVTVAGGDQLCEYGASAGAGGSGECGSGHCEPDLFANVLPERAVGADPVSAALASPDRSRAADVSPGAVDAGRVWVPGAGLVGDGALQCAGWVYAADARGLLGVVQP